MPGRRSTQEIFGEVLREVRLERGLSQEELALASDLHRTYISQLERGENSPTLRAFEQVADALEMRASDLLRRIEQHS